VFDQEHSFYSQICASILNTLFYGIQFDFYRGNNTRGCRVGMVLFVAEYVHELQNVDA